MPKKRIPTTEELKMIEEMNNKHYITYKYKEYDDDTSQYYCRYQVALSYI